MLNEQELIASLQLKLDRASESRNLYRAGCRCRRRRSHESHLAYADGLVDGIESAIVAIVAMHHRLEKASAATTDTRNDK
jgi:hypothetical protein